MNMGGLNLTNRNSIMKPRVHKLKARVSLLRGNYGGRPGFYTLHVHLSSNSKRRGIRQFSCKTRALDTTAPLVN